MSTALSIKLLSKKDVQEKLCICERTLENMVRNRMFPPGLRMGKHVKWVEAAVDKWLENSVQAQLNWKNKRI